MIFTYLVDGEHVHERRPLREGAEATAIVGPCCAGGEVAAPCAVPRGAVRRLRRGGEACGVAPRGKGAQDVVRCGARGTAWASPYSPANMGWATARLFARGEEPRPTRTSR